MKVIAFAASNHKKSINKQLVSYASSLLKNATIEILDLNDYALPMFDVDKELEIGQPQLAKDFLNKIAESDAIIISFAEHNGSYTVAYKNLFDWCSRIEKKVFQNKALILLATSPGPGGAKTVLTLANTSAPHFGGVVKASLSIPKFHDNFDSTKGCISNAELNQKLSSTVNALYS